MKKLLLLLLFTCGIATAQTQTANITVNIDGTTYTVVAMSEMSDALTGYTQGQLDLHVTGFYGVFEAQDPAWTANNLFFLPGYTDGRYTVQHFISRQYHLYDGETYIDAYDYSPDEARCQPNYVSHQSIQRRILEIISQR